MIPHRAASTSQGLAAWLPSPTLHLLLGVLAVLVYVVSTRMHQERRAPSTAIAWVVALLLLPYVVLPLYLLFGQRKTRPARPPRRPRHTQQDVAADWAASLIESFDLAPPSVGIVDFHRDGLAARDALWHVIASARTRLDVCTFIIGRDALGDETIARLAARARDGVQVRLILDGFGALKLSRRHFDTLRQAGGKVTVFRPLLKLRQRGKGNLRNHRKMVIADDFLLWAGGRNLAAEYFLGTPGEPPWLDLSFTLQGGAAAAAAHQFEQDWASARQQPARSITRAAEVHHGSATQFLPSGPDQAEDTALTLLIAACFRAEQRILAVTPYFIPGDRLRDALRTAARRGVEVTIVLPQASNHQLADFARMRAMRDLAEAGVHFLMLPSMVHAKAVVVDEHLALCGSINLDQRSLLVNHESAVVFYNPADLQWLADWIHALGRRSQAFQSTPPGLARDLSEGLLLAVAFQL
ncbi:phospholipase D-like domain-containing protein [Variovorax sp. HJSM1_2]|uniref:phospholipase D-like domain-containing protein n=1 Tax=Variovorax sp. HJSM1_2 TaxID=3366263 RepID=UPI003BCC2DC7